MIFRGMVNYCARGQKVNTGRRSLFTSSKLFIIFGRAVHKAELCVTCKANLGFAAHKGELCVTCKAILGFAAHKAELCVTRKAESFRLSKRSHK